MLTGGYGHLNEGWSVKVKLKDCDRELLTFMTKIC